MACPHDGGPAWTEVNTDHVRLRTNLPAATAEQLGAEVENAVRPFAAITDFFLPNSGGELGRTTLVMFAEKWEYDRVIYDYDRAMQSSELARTMITEDRSEAWIALAADAYPAESFRHELTHRLVSQRIGQVPRWLDEGLAEYFSRIGRTPSGKHALGLPTSRLASALRVSSELEPLPLEAVFSGAGTGTVNQLLSERVGARALPGQRRARSRRSVPPVPGLAVARAPWRESRKNTGRCRARSGVSHAAPAQLRSSSTCAAGMCMPEPSAGLASYETRRPRARRPGIDDCSHPRAACCCGRTRRTEVSLLKAHVGG